MRTRPLAFACFLITLTATANSGAAATGDTSGEQNPVLEEVADLRRVVHDLAATVEDQARLISALQNEPRMQPLVSAPYPGPGGPPAPAALRRQLPPVTPGAAASPPSGALAALNPQIGVVGDVVGNVSTENAEGVAGTDQFTFRELEIVFGGFVDPYSRADFAVVLNEDEGSRSRRHSGPTTPSPTVSRGNSASSARSSGR